MPEVHLSEKLAALEHAVCENGGHGIIIAVRSEVNLCILVLFQVQSDRVINWLIHGQEVTREHLPRQNPRWMSWLFVVGIHEELRKCFTLDELKVRVDLVLVMRGLAHLFGVVFKTVL
jgi:hypothetical protein